MGKCVGDSPHFEGLTISIRTMKFPAFISSNLKIGGTFKRLRKVEMEGGSG